MTQSTILSSGRINGADTLTIELIQPASTPAVVRIVWPWSKLNTVWRGVSLDTLLDDADTEADFALVPPPRDLTVPMPALRAPGGWLN